MNATNLSMCFTPNLVSSSNIMRDTQLCSIPHTSFSIALATTPSPGSLGNPAPQKMTLGVVIKVCIEQYFEIFEELPNRTAAMSSHPSISFTLPLSGSTPSANSTLRETPPDRNTPEGSHLDAPSQGTSPRTPFSPSSVELIESFTTSEGSDSDPDESMLVMPIGLSSPTPSSYQGAEFPSSPPSAWASPASPKSANLQRGIGIGHPSSPLTNQRHRRKGSASQSIQGSAQSAHESHRSMLRPTRSMISIERRMNGTGASGGSIRIGRGGAGGTRRASGAGVEAIGITAAGFFSPVSVEAETSET